MTLEQRYIYDTAIVFGTFKSNGRTGIVNFSFGKYQQDGILNYSFEDGDHIGVPKMVAEALRFQKMFVYD